MGVKRKTQGEIHTIVVSDVLNRLAEDAEGDGADKRRKSLQQAAADFEGMEVDVVHEGAPLLKRWSMKGRQAQLANARELAKLRKGMSKDLAPELYSDDFDPPGADERLDAYSRDCLKDAVRAVRGVDDHDPNAPPEEHAEVILELGLREVILAEASEIQKLLKSQSFS